MRRYLLFGSILFILFFFALNIDSVFSLALAALASVFIGLIIDILKGKI